MDSLERPLALADNSIGGKLQSAGQNASTRAKLRGLMKREGRNLHRERTLISFVMEQHSRRSRDNAPFKRPVVNKITRGERVPASGIKARIAAQPRDLARLTLSLYDVNGEIKVRDVIRVFSYSMLGARAHFYATDKMGMSAASERGVVYTRSRLPSVRRAEGAAGL